MFIYPEINPVFIHLGPLKIHWYGLMYLAGFAAAYGLARWRVSHYQLAFTKEQVSDFIFYAALGVVCGGRIGYMLFYNFSALYQHPFSLFALWQGGMSFHGGLIGVGLALCFFSKKTGKSFFALCDFAAPLVPIGLGLGRIGNFINGELWGRVTTVPWAFIFQHVDNYPRHPSQLYEFFLEGVLLFAVVWLYSAKPRATGSVTGVFLLGYGLCRFFVEFFRQPDLSLGFVALDWLTMGQVLSLPMILFGVYLLGRGVKTKSLAG